MRRRRELATGRGSSTIIGAFLGAIMFSLVYYLTSLSLGKIDTESMIYLSGAGLIAGALLGFYSYKVVVLEETKVVYLNDPEVGEELQKLEEREKALNELVRLLKSENRELKEKLNDLEKEMSEKDKK